MAIVVARKPVASAPAPAPVKEAPPAPVDTSPQMLAAVQANLEQQTKANEAFLAALRHEFAKQNYKSITATVQRDKTGKIEKIHMEVER